MSARNALALLFLVGPTLATQLRPQSTEKVGHHCPQLAVPVLLATEINCHLLAERDLLTDCILRYEKRCADNIDTVPKSHRQSVNLPLSSASGAELTAADFESPLDSEHPLELLGFTAETSGSCGIVEPPRPRSGCHWIPLRDAASRCLVEYEERCRVLGAVCPDIARPAGRKGCDLVSLHDDQGCISSFRCEPKNCIPVDEPERLFACVWFPVRDGNGCTVSFDCLPGAEESDQLSSFAGSPEQLSPVSLNFGVEDPTQLGTPVAAKESFGLGVGTLLRAAAEGSECPQTPRPGNVACPLVALTDTRGCIVSFECQSPANQLSFSGEGVVKSQSCPLLQTPPAVPGCVWEPKRSPETGCVTEHNLQCTQSERLVASLQARAACRTVKPPSLTGSLANCQLKTIHDNRGCVIEYRCVKPQVVSNPCQQVVPPDAVAGCVWSPVKDSDGCTISFQCDSTPSTSVTAASAPRCGIEPTKPDTHGRCRWLPIKDNSGCIVDFQCEIQPLGDLASILGAAPQIGVPVSKSKTIIGPQPALPQGTKADNTPRIERIPIPNTGNFFTLAPAIPTQAPVARVRLRKVGSVSLLEPPVRGQIGASGATELCDSPPTKPISRGLCEWTPIRDPNLCIINYECTPKTQIPKPRRPPQIARLARRKQFCPKAPTRPEDNSFCVWLPETDARGCVVNFRCQRQPRPQSTSVVATRSSASRAVPCGKAPPRPQSVLGCRWHPVHGPDACLIDWQCEPKASAPQRKISSAAARSETAAFPEKRGLDPHPAAVALVQPLVVPERLAVPRPKSPPIRLVTREPTTTTTTAATTTTTTPTTTRATSPDPFLNLAIGNAPRRQLREQAEGDLPVALPPQPIPCPPEPSKPADTRRCAYVPLRDESGCVLNYHCQIRTSVPKLVCRSVFFGAKQICELEATSVPIDGEGDRETAVAPRTGSASQRVELVELPDNEFSASSESRQRESAVSRRRATTAAPRTRRPTTPIPRTTTEEPANCRHRSRPVLPSPSPSCNWIEIKDQIGCIISYRCEPKSRVDPRIPIRAATDGDFAFSAEKALASTLIGPREPTSEEKEDDHEPKGKSGQNCRVSPVAPTNSDRCNWVGIRNADGCIIDFECEPVPIATTTRVPCLNEPKKPRRSKTCDWLAIRHSNGCVREYECRRYCEDVANSFECFQWSRQGLCYHNIHFMDNNCQRTCGFCTEGRTSGASTSSRARSVSRIEQRLRRARGRDNIDDYQ